MHKIHARKKIILKPSKIKPLVLKKSRINAAVIVEINAIVPAILFLLEKYRRRHDRERGHPHLHPHHLYRHVF